MKEAFVAEILRSVSEGQIYTLKRVEEIVEMLREQDHTFMLYESTMEPDNPYAMNNTIFQVRNKEFSIVFISRKYHPVNGVSVKCIYNHVFNQF